MLLAEKSKTRKEMESGKLMFQRDTSPKKALLKDFDIIAMIGKGSMSNVFLVRKIDTDAPLAMKSIDKEKVLADGVLEGTRLE